MRLKVFIAILMVVWSTYAISYQPEIPGIIGIIEYSLGHNGQTLVESKTTLSVKREPDAASRTIAELSRFDEAAAYEWSYEDLGLAAFGYLFEENTTWYKVYVTEQKRFGWIRKSPELTFHPLSGLLSHSLTYLTGRWNKALYADPSLPQSKRVLAITSEETPIAVASTAMIENKLWVLVVVLQQSPCSSTEAPSVLASGWVPALANNGLPNMWFYARGC